MQSVSASADEIMSIRSGYTFLVLFGIISVVILNSATPISDPAKETKIKWSSPSSDLQKESFKTRNSVFKEDQNLRKEGNAFNVLNGHEENNSVLQKRGIGSMIFGTMNLNGNSIGSFSSGGDNYYDFSASGSQMSSGSYLSMNVKGVQVQVFSPRRSQNVSFKGEKVFVNNKLVCGGIGDLSDERTYQKGEDASLWYTNLKVGKELTTKEIEEFKLRVEEIEAEMEKIREEARKQREAALAEGRRQREEARKQREAALEEGRRQREEAKKQREAALEEGRRQREEAKKQREAALEEGRRQREDARKQREQALADAKKQREEAQKQREEALAEAKRQREEAQKQREAALEEARKQREEAQKQREAALEEARKQREQAQRQREAALEEAQKQREAALEEARKQREEAQKQREAALEEARIQREEAQREREAALAEAQKQREAALVETSRQRDEARKQTEDAGSNQLGDSISSNISGNANFDFGSDDFDLIASGSQKSSGFYLTMDGMGVRVQAFSPRSNQKVAFKGKKVFVNNKAVCMDTKNLNAERTYQKREDGSMWYTNLKVGKGMTRSEIEDFNRAVANFETESKKTGKQRKTAQVEVSRLQQETSRQRESPSEVKNQEKGARNQKNGARQVGKGQREAVRDTRNRNRNKARQTRGAVKKGTTISY